VRIVADTNILISALLAGRSLPVQIIDLRTFLARMRYLP